LEFLAARVLRRAADECADGQGLPSDSIVRILKGTDEGRAALAAVEADQISQRDYEKMLGRLLGVDDCGLLGRALGDLRPRQEVLDLAHRARTAGIPVGILSNSWGTGDYDPYRGYDLEENFDAVVISDQVGLRKPDPAIYRADRGQDRGSRRGVRIR
jgi:FMN phosphatase YigB (HAD superfamily)